MRWWNCNTNVLLHLWFCAPLNLCGSTGHASARVIVAEFCFSTPLPRYCGLSGRIAIIRCAGSQARAGNCSAAAGGSSSSCNVGCRGGVAGRESAEESADSTGSFCHTCTGPSYCPCGTSNPRVTAPGGEGVLRCAMGVVLVVSGPMHWIMALTVGSAHLRKVHGTGRNEEYNRATPWCLLHRSAAELDIA